MQDQKTIRPTKTRANINLAGVKETSNVGPLGKIKSRLSQLGQAQKVN